MKTFRLLVSLAIALIAAVVALRYRSLRVLQTEQVRLRQQVEEAKPRSIVSPITPMAATATNTALSATERTELLRLRGETGLLRQELAEETNQLAKPTVAGTTATTPDPGRDAPVVSRQQAMVKMKIGTQCVLALILHAEANGGQLPATLAGAAQYNAAAKDGDDFELVLSGSLRTIESPPRTIVLREKQPWKDTNGRWNRGYGFADGHVEIATSPTADFTEWEKRRTAANDPAPGQ